MFSGREDGIIPYPLTDYMYPNCRFSTQLNSTHIGCRHCRLDNFLSSFGGSVFPKCSGWLYMITVVPLALFVPHGAFWMHSFDIFLKQKQVANTGKRWEEILSSFPYVSYLFRMFYETAKCQGQAHRQVQSPVARPRGQRWSLGCRGRKTQGAGVLDVLEFCRFRLDFQALLLRRIYMNLQQYYTVIIWTFVSIRSLSQEYGKERNTDFPVPGECLRHAAEQAELELAQARAAAAEAKAALAAAKAAPESGTEQVAPGCQTESCFFNDFLMIF